MRLRERKSVAYGAEDASDDSSADGSLAVAGKRRTRSQAAAAAKKNRVTGSDVIIPDSESGDEFESPRKRTKAYQLRKASSDGDDPREIQPRQGMKLRRSNRARHKEAVISDDDEKYEKPRSRLKEREEADSSDFEDTSREKVAKVQQGKSSRNSEAARPRRSCAVRSKPLNAVEDRRKIAELESGGESISLEEEADEEEEANAEDEDSPEKPEASSAQYTVDKYGLQVNGQYPPPKRTKEVEKVLAVRDRSSDLPVYCVKEHNKSYRDVATVTEETLRRYVPTLLRNFLKRLDSLGREDGHTGASEDGPAFDPQYLIVDRIVASEQRGRARKYYVKWKGLPYTDATWERQESIVDNEPLRRFVRTNTGATGPLRKIMVGFKDHRTLRDYQLEGVAWLYRNYEQKINCILADEMGLGKTIQSIAMLENLRSKRKAMGPFLVIVPVSTIGHWQREIESLTDMNCVVYGGSQEDRVIIQQYEFWNPKINAVKFTVLLTSFEILLKDLNVLKKTQWEYIIVDEAHRLKSRESKTACALGSLNIKEGSLLLLTGTPVQNNTKEIFSLLNLLDPKLFNSEEQFLQKYGNIQDIEQLKDLQENILKPRLLRRMKEDVEKSIPLKEETIIWVELTKEQRSYYRAIYENKIHELMKGSQASNMPNLRNMSMELRKLCNHPFLCDGLEDDFNSKYSTNKSLVQSSGKMVLLDKMLPMLNDGGHRVLIFSQFTIMLDILEDYLTAKDYSFERIDGKIRGSDRQAAIDRYSASDSKVFVFLLSTRAGGLGITLTAADTCIIYDSDWNPQNDLQAMARCHRIGQTKDVKIYRLITKNTYEQHLFECSSRKYGLDEAILGKFQDEQEGFSKNIENLLRRGAYDMLREDGDQEAEAFDAENIDHILQQRTQKRVIGGRGNNTFSVATFVSVEDLKHENAEMEMEAEDFWKQMLPAACDRKLNEPAKVVGVRPRRRQRVDYRENKPRSDSEGSTGSDEEGKQGNWKASELRHLEDALVMFGKVSPDRLSDEASLEGRTLSEVEQVVDTLVRLCHYFHERSFDDSIAEPAVPSFAESAFKRAMPRLEKKASRYLQIFKELEIIDRALQEQDLGIYLPRSSKLPKWWGEAEDVDLIKGVRMYGRKSFLKIRNDPALCFLSKFSSSDDIEESEESGGVTWPSDAVLAGRLRGITNALSKRLRPLNVGDKPCEEASSGECRGLKQSTILKQNKRIVSERPDENKAGPNTKRMKAIDGTSERQPKEHQTQQHGDAAQAIIMYVDNSSSSDNDGKVQPLAHRKPSKVAAPPALEMNKENLVPKVSGKRKNAADSKQSSLLGYFSAKPRS